MPYCPTCKKSFPDQTVCPEDAANLVDELPFQTVDGETTTWVEIASASTDDEARIIQGFFEAEGIPCRIESLKFGMEPVNLGTMGEIRIYVSSESEQQANELLQRREKDYDSLVGDESVMTDEGSAEIADDAETAAETE
jgi:hypothetical protein